MKYQDFKQNLNLLEKLQKFKKPLTDLIDNIIYSNNFESVIEPEFYLLHESKEEFENLDEELEITALKLARLLELKENEAKDYIKKHHKEF